ncbi:MAG: serine/threonine-protein kinase [Polyangiaceae bacterium]
MTPTRPGLPRRSISPALPNPLVPPAPATRRTHHHAPDAKRTVPKMRAVTQPSGVLPLRSDHRSSQPVVNDASPLIVTPRLTPNHLSRRPPVSRGLELARLSEVLAGETLMGRYRVEIPLGRGSTGIVFRAYDLARATTVAIKLLDPELAAEPSVVDRFRVEALAPTRIGTAHVVEVYEAGVCPELSPLVQPEHPLGPPIPYLVMELLEGKDLRQYVHEQGAMTFEEVGDVLGQIAPTIDRAHELGIVHRDLKPANIFLSRRPDSSSLVKILDFGIAELTDASAARGLGGGLFGTPWYMAPEQAEGRNATAASDRWALAIVAFRLLTAQSYWAPCPIPELLGQILGGVILPPTEVVRARGLSPRAPLPRAFDVWFAKACALDPRARFSTAVAQADALRQALAASPLELPYEAPSRLPSRPPPAS